MMNWRKPIFLFLFTLVYFRKLRMFMVFRTFLLNTFQLSSWIHIYIWPTSETLNIYFWKMSRSKMTPYLHLTEKHQLISTGNAKHKTVLESFGYLKDDSDDLLCCKRNPRPFSTTVSLATTFVPGNSFTSRSQELTADSTKFSRHDLGGNVTVFCSMLLLSEEM